MKNGNLAQDFESASLNYHGVFTDDNYLDQMRAIIKGYVAVCRESKMTLPIKQRCQTEFEDLRQQLSDPMLKEYSSFEFMEKLYMQEYTAVSQ